MLGIDLLELVRINQIKWGRGLSKKSRFKEGTEVVLPHGVVSAEAVANAAARVLELREAAARSRAAAAAERATEHVPGCKCLAEDKQCKEKAQWACRECHPSGPFTITFEEARCVTLPTRL